MKKVCIANREISLANKPFIIAEMSGNHNQSLSRALAIVDAAVKAGVDAIKLQTYTADTMTLDIAEGDFLITDPKSLWYGEHLYTLYQKAYTPWEWHKEIFDYCKKVGIICFSTPFNETAVDFLEDFDVPCYKISSFENTDVRLVKKIAATGKPVIISTGMASLADLELMVNTLQNANCQDFILLKCTSAYPADPGNINLLTLPHLQQAFNCQVGISDHTLGIGVAIAATVLGAVVIEKHFTLSRAEGGVDAAFSMEPEEMRLLVIETERAWQALGKVTYELSGEEKKSLQFRRSIYITRDIQEGEVFSLKNIERVRPGLGLPAKYFDMLLGKRVNRNLKRGTPVSWDIIG